jgi:hypothetical protein
VAAIGFSALYPELIVPLQQYFSVNNIDKGLYLFRNWTLELNSNFVELNGTKDSC